MPSDGITYIIASRNRLSSLCACIDSLNAAHEIAFPNSKSDLIIVNDSTFTLCDSSIKSCIEKLRLKSLRPFVIGQNYFRNVKATITSILDRETDAAFSSILRPLGADGWNLYSARNLAWLYTGSMRQKDDLICMVDDDVMAGPTFYQGMNFTPTVGQFLLKAKTIANNFNFFAVGPRFLGREDITCLIHIIKSIRRHSLLSNSSSISIFPYSYSSTFQELDRKEPVPSGGLMLTNVNTIRCLPLMPFYNEDWIWAKLISKMQGAHVCRASQFAIHAPLAAELPTSELISFQEIGEVIYSTISLLCKSNSRAPSKILENFDPKIFDSCFWGRLALISRYRNEITKAKNLSSIIKVPKGISLKDWSITTLDHAIMQLKLIDRNAIIDWFSSFVKIVYWWPKIFDKVRRISMVEHDSQNNNC